MFLTHKQTLSVENGCVNRGDFLSIYAQNRVVYGEKVHALGVFVNFLPSLASFLVNAPKLSIMTEKWAIKSKKDCDLMKNDVFLRAI